MIYKLVNDENGNYTKDGLKHVLLEASEYIDSPEGRNIDCFVFDTIEQAEIYFGVVKIVEELNLAEMV